MPQGRTAGLGSPRHLPLHTTAFPHLFTKNIFLMLGLDSARLDSHFYFGTCFWPAPTLSLCICVCVRLGGSSLGTQG